MLLFNLPCDDGEVWWTNAGTHEQAHVLVTYTTQLHDLFQELTVVWLQRPVKWMYYDITVPATSVKTIENINIIF